MMIISEALSAVACRDTPALLRARAMGFELEHATVTWTGEAIRLTGAMRCVCRRRENFDFTISLDPSALDPAALLMSRGAFDEGHLRSDGYSLEETAAIVAKGNLYDLANP